MKARAAVPADRRWGRAGFRFRFRFLCHLAAGLLLALPALAQRASGDTLPAALQGVRQAGQCARADYAPGAASRPAAAPAGEQADLACAIAPAQVLAQTPTPGQASRTAFTWVDLRPAPERESGSIAGSLPMSISALKSRSYLRDKPLLLVGNGKGERELYIACGALKRAGFQQLRVLAGGVPAWLAAGQTLLGPAAPASAQVPRLSAPELWAEAHFDAKLLLLAPSHAGLKDVLVGAQLLPQLSSAAVQAAVQAAMKAAQERRRKAAPKSSPDVALQAPLLGVVLVGDEQGLNDERVRALQQALPGVPLLVYARPATEFMADMGQQQRLWNAHASGPKSPPCGP